MARVMNWARPKARRTQQVTCKMALVSGGFCFSSSMACSVGTMNNSTLRRSASACTSFITGKAPCAGADYQATALPRYPFLQRQRCVSESFTELLGSFFLPLAYLAAVDHDVVVVADPIDPNGAKGEFFESHGLISLQ